MSYDIEKTYTNFWGGISDDDFIWPENSVLEMDSIDAQTNERYIQCMDRFTVDGDYSHTWTALWIKETSYWPFRGWSWVINPTWTILTTGLVTVDGMESVWSGLTQINYFFGRTDWVRKTDYIGTTNIGAISTTGYPTANTEVTAIWTHVTNILFGKDNLVYSYSTTTDTTVLAATLTPWTKIKYIYSYSYDSVVVATTNGNDTFIYELEFTGSAYTIVSKTPIYSAKLLSAVGNYNELYWVSRYWIHIYQARQNQFVKAVTLSEDTNIWYNRWVVLIDGSAKIRYYNKKKPGRNIILSETTTSYTANLISNTAILWFVTGGSRLLYQWGAYKRDNFLTLRPLDGGIYNVPKADLSYRFWYMFQAWAYPNPWTAMKISILIQTDWMEMINTAKYISVGEITDSTNGISPDSLGNPRYGYMEITPNMVKDALQTAWYPSTFWYARTKILLQAWDEFTTPTWYYRKAPKLFDLTIKANFVKK